MKIINLMFGDLDFKKYLALVGTGVIIVLARVCSLGLFVYAAREMATLEYAGLVYATSMAQIIVQLSSLGWLNLIRRESSRFDLYELGHIKGFVLRSFQIPFFVLSIVLFFAGIFLFNDIFPVSLSVPIFYCLVMTCPLLLVSVFREYFAGFGRPAMSVFTSETMPLLLSLVSFFIFKINGVKDAVIYLIICQLVGVVTQVFILAPQFLQYLSAKNSIYETVRWTRVAGFTVVGYGGKLLMDRMDILLIAPLAGMSQLAIFNSTSRISAVILLVPLVLIQFFAPRIGKLFGHQNMVGLKSEIFLQLKLISLALLPIVLFMVIYSDQVMGWVFGAKYIEGADILWLSVVANVMFAYALPFSSMLIMTDGERPYAICSLLGLFVYVSFGLLLIPTKGIHGASVAMVLATGTMSAGLIWTALRRLKERF